MYPVGLFVHVPVEVVSVEFCFEVPVIVGSALFCGGNTAAAWKAFPVFCVCPLNEAYVKWIAVEKALESNATASTIRTASGMRFT